MGSVEKVSLVALSSHEKIEIFRIVFFILPKINVIFDKNPKFLVYLKKKSKSAFFLFHCFVVQFCSCCVVFVTIGKTQFTHFNSPMFQNYVEINVYFMFLTKLFKLFKLHHFAICVFNNAVGVK